VRREGKTWLPRCKKGRFAGLSTTDRCLGALSLKPFALSEGSITVDANVRGRLQAEFRDPYGRPLAGFELNSCRPVTGDSGRHELTWTNGKGPRDYLYDVLGLRIEIEDGTIYSVGV
jgi:hypothetical protein